MVRKALFWMVATLCALGYCQEDSETQAINLTFPAPLRTHFSQWYPEAGQYLPGIITTFCLRDYSIYLGNITNPYPPACKNCRIQPATTCILNNWDESTKANAASAAVLLGLVPTILALIGPTTLETALLAMKRPFLTFLLAAASPSVNPMRTLDYTDPAEILQVRPREIKFTKLTTGVALVVSAIEYILAAGAVANLCIVSYQLSVRTICSFAQETFFMPALYAFLAIFIHGAGAWAMGLRYSIQTTGNKPQSVMQSFLMREALPTSCHEPSDLVPKDESWLFVVLTWLGSTGTVLHIIFGTLVFSSTLFLTTSDALVVIVQYFASTLVAATILRFEIAGMRQTLRLPRESDEASSDSETGYKPVPTDRKGATAS